MTKILAQHGAAKGKKIEVAMSNNYLSGIIFSPREEKFSSIEQYATASPFLNKSNVFLDSQLYYSTFEGKIFKNLESNPLYPTKVTRREWRKKSPEFLQYLDMHASDSSRISNNLITPGFYIQDLNWKFDYSLDIYNYCYENYTFAKYYLSLLISNNFFHSKADIDEMLEDIIDNVDNKQGIYLTICYENNQEKNYEYIDAQNLANIMYFIYSLKKAGFEILSGYNFVNSILFSMLECEYVATGWFNNLRKFSKDRFEEVDSMGRRKKKYTSLPLFSYITFENLNNIKEVMDIDILLSGCNVDSNVIYNQDAISFVDLEQQYWQALDLFIKRINSYNDISDKIKFVLDEINNAKELYGEILDKLSNNKEAYNRVKIEAKHLDSWIMGIETFKKRIALIV